MLTISGLGADMKTATGKYSTAPSTPPDWWSRGGKPPAVVGPDYAKMKAQAQAAADAAAAAAQAQADQAQADAVAQQAADADAAVAAQAVQQQSQDAYVSPGMQVTPMVQASTTPYALPTQIPWVEIGLGLVGVFAGVMVGRRYKQPVIGGAVGGVAAYLGGKWIGSNLSFYAG